MATVTPLLKNNDDPNVAQQQWLVLKFLTLNWLFSSWKCCVMREGILDADTEHAVSRSSSNRC